MKKLAILLIFILSLNLLANETHIVRYEYKNKIYYGELKKDRILELNDNIYDELKVKKQLSCQKIQQMFTLKEN